jgi:hypothetical protein
MAKTPQTNTPPATVSPERSLALVADNAASRRFGEYVEQRDDIMSLPYFQPRAAAKAGVPFTITRAVERTVKPPEGTERATTTIDVFLYLVVLQDRLTIVDETTGEAKQFEAGTRGLIQLEKLEGGVRSTDFDRIVVELAEYGEVPNLALQEYPSTKKGRANSTGLTDARKWRPVLEIARERGMLKE